MDHSVRLQVTCGGGTMGWHFSSYDSPELTDFVIKGIPKSRYTKLQRMDDGSSHGRMKRGERFDETFSVAGPGIFIFDVSNWSNDCIIDAAITVDGQLFFSTSSYGIARPDNASFNLSNWLNTFASGSVRQTDDREIAFPLD